MADRQKILVVDDSKTQLDWVQQVLVREGFDVRTAGDGKEAIRKVRTEPPDLVLLDMVLPDMDGLEVLRIVKARSDEHFIPVIILSVKADLDSKVAGLRIGADDFLAKPFAEAELLARCAAMLRIKKLQDELRATQQKLAEQSITDALTGLRNRRFFDERLHEEFGRAQRYADPVSLIMLDIDHFKKVNDKYGHQVGDVVLRESAGLLKASLRDPDIPARYGGEEFAVILPKTHVQGALAVAERVWRAIGTKVFRHSLGEGPSASPPVELRVTVSLGVAFFPSKDITTADLLVKFADEALYQAKHSGRNSICLYQAQAYKYEAGP
jgi:diguanylate cyclase (GGDEF)-like protein